MKSLAEIGQIIQINPWDEIHCYFEEKQMEVISDRSSFRFMVEGRLEDGQIFYGLWGPIVSGHERYVGLVCSVVVRADGADWTKNSKCQARVDIGPTKVTRNHEYDFRHPDGTKRCGFPQLATIGEIVVVS